MKLCVVLFVVCVVSLTEALRLARQADVSTTATPESASQCCYPRPPKSRNFKRCCHVPTEIIFKSFEADREACKEEMKKKHQEEETEASSSTTTPAPPQPVEKEEADLDAMDADVDDINEVVETPTANDDKHNATARRGKGWKCHHKHHKRGKGKCLIATMEKYGWSNKGSIDWSAISRDLDNSDAPAELLSKWAPVMKDAVQNCSKQLTIDNEVTPKPEGRQHARWFSPERAAMKCMKNNAIMNCPDFPEEDEYCKTLREVHQRCGARKQPGKKRLPWCEPKNRSHHHHGHKA